MCRPENVAGLQVPVDDAAAVRGVERVGNLNGVGERLCERHRTALEPRGERLTLQILEHQVVDRRVPPDVVQRADVRVGESGDRLRFAIEPRAKLRIAGQRWRSTFTATVRFSLVSVARYT